MADFYQNGMITTLHNLQNRATSELEQELTDFAIHRPMGLILPSLYSELHGPALSNIVNELSQVPYLNQIVIGLDRANAKEYRHALNFFSRMPQEHKVLWNDGPRLKAIDDNLKNLDLAPKELGKGRNVWYCMGYILASGRTESIALHDCDITTYDRSLLARLIYPVAHPSFSYEFCKGYYARTAHGRMHGRACRLPVSYTHLTLPTNREV